MGDFSLPLDPGLARQLARVIDAEGKIPRALAALGPLADRDVVLVDGAAGLRARQIRAAGARLIVLAADADRPDSPLRDLERDGVAVRAGTSRDTGLEAATADVLVACWSSFCGPDPDELREAGRVLRPGGRLLVVHDYGRDDVSALRDETLPEYVSWGRRSGPFLAGGFKIRVVHAWWTFESVEEGRALLHDAFGARGDAIAERMHRPRLSYNVAVYHRTLNGRA